MTAGYCLLRATLYPVARLPKGILYLLADFLFVVLCCVVRYRRRVITANLRHAFPEKPDGEIARIRRAYYRNLGDIIVETIRMMALRRNNFEKHCRILNPEVLHDYYQKGRGILVVTGHFGIWEWAALALAYYARHRCFAAYKPLHNKAVDRLYLMLRSRMNLTMVPMRHAVRHILTHKDVPIAVNMAVDQTPGMHESPHWMTFLNQDTPVYMGTEKMARKTGMAVLYFDLERVRRGYYEIRVVTLFDDPQNTAPGEITERHTRYLESKIWKYPPGWLWSHRRWKHKRV